MFINNASFSTAQNVKVVLSTEHASLPLRIKDACLQIRAGQFWHILGPNGAGKSSLLSMMAGIIKPETGSVEYFGQCIQQMGFAEQAKVRCFLQQQQASEFDIPLSQLLEFYAHMSQVPQLLDNHLAINQYLSKPLSQLSGGQQQRFHIARTLCQVWPCIIRGNALIILDEPVAQLDVKYQSAIMQCLTDLCVAGNTVISSCHDINLSLLYASHVALIKNQQVVTSGAASKVLTQQTLTNVYEYPFTQLYDAASGQKYLVGSSNNTI